ncbi:DUF397 domain-containing protein [Streptomyces sp. HU2014]|uniref:DUF397 domain-containing protein n=1 Tax=Streptomyces sp. HU2014 TaxID=2939414 RepID=UPI00200E93E0|nr:DUF397 domain-containing protein [Streptomyces sp. HU2014]UQI48330.1 DUF397 domain-containing protein [Streptomyces sp. HU2014]
MATGDRDLAVVGFKKSSYSSTQGATCVEIALPGGMVTGPISIRDSKRPTGPTLHIHPAAYTAFTQALARGELTRAAA